MAQREIVILVCDGCGADGADGNGEVTEHKFGIDGNTWVLDSCQKCWRGQFQEALKPITRFAQRVRVAKQGNVTAVRERSTPLRDVSAPPVVSKEPKPAARKRGERETLTYRCPFGDELVATSRRDIYKHLQLEHGTSHGFYGLTAGRCPMCGNHYPQASKRSLARHVTDVHGMETVADALAAARDSGDPFGVYASAVDQLHQPASA